MNDVRAGQVAATWAMARRSLEVARGLRRTVRAAISPADARRSVRREVLDRDETFLEGLDLLVWPHATSPTRQLLEAAGASAGDVRQLVRTEGLDRALEVLRDRGVFVTYEEYQGKVPARRGSTELHLSPPAFFNPLTKADYIATTGGSRSSGTPMELSFAWQLRQGRQRAIVFDMLDALGAPGAIWLPVFPSAAGFGALMKNAAGGNLVERWFSQVPVDVGGISSHKGLANRMLPVVTRLAGAGLAAPEHVPTSDPDPVVDWLASALRRNGRALLTGYASSLTAAARRASERGIDLTGVLAFPASEPVTAGKLSAMRDAGMRPFPMYAFVPEGTVGFGCEHGDDESYHLWSQDLAVTTRRRGRGDGTDVDALCWTSLALEAPRVLLNVENDDYGRVERDVHCGCPLNDLGLTTKVADIRGISKVVAAGVSVEGHVFDDLAEVVLPDRFGGGPGDYQFVELDTPTGTAVQLRIAPVVGPVDTDAVLAAVRADLAANDNGRLADEIWAGALVVDRRAPSATRAGKALSFERIGSPPPPAASPSSSRSSDPSPTTPREPKATLV